MGESNESLLKAVKHYQDSLDRHTENRNENKLLHYLDRLYKLSIKVVHLEQTGVGRTVNGLRKLGGEVGESARRLVNKWKEMVVGEQEEEDEEDEEDGYQTGEDQSSDGDSKNHEVEKVRENSSSHRKSDKSHNGTDDKDKVRKSKDNSSKSSRSSESKSSSEKDKDRHRENGHERHKSHKRKAESSSEDESPKKKRYEDDNRHKKRVESDSEDEKRSRDKQHKKSEKKNHRESSDDESEVETKSKERRHKSDKRKTRELSDDDSDDESRGRDKRKSDKYKSLDRPSTSKDTHRDKHKHSKKDDSKRHEHSSKTKENEKKSKHKSEEKERVRDKSDDRKDKKKVVNGSLTKTGIDSGSGTSFAEALGMCEPSSSKGSTKKPPKAPEKKDKPTIKLDDPIPKLLKDPNIANIEPLDLNISSLLPPITPNYRPLGNLISSESQAKKWLSESEALTNSITSKNQRTKVYSGNKVAFGKVPSLFELCTRILQDNIDALEYTGGVPYLILKPILEKATPNQLYVMEHHNPYLMDDTVDLWQLHCQKEFRNKHREELETWREMYLRCLDERDAKLKALTANIKQSQDKSLPVRTTKLAYVDAVAKPPRNIARKQAKNGTAFDIRKPAMTPTARLNSLATAGEAGKVAVPNPGSRAVERSSGHSHSAKPKKAPLMLKSISSFKNRFKR